jgi:hypothetical protein
MAQAPLRPSEAGGDCRDSSIAASAGPGAAAPLPPPPALAERDRRARKARRTILTYPGVLFWILILATAFRPGPAFYYVFFGSWSLGTLAVVPGAVSLGNLTPPWIAACVLAARVVLEEGGRRWLAALFDPRRFGLLTACTLYAAASGYFLPRIFDGQVQVITMRTSEVHGAVPLQPDTANLTQGLYFVITTVAVVSIYFVCQDAARRRQFLQAMGFGAAVAIVTGLADLFASAAGLGGLLVPFRNASYALLLDNDAVGMHRVVGLMSEASAYAGLCVPFLCLVALTPSKDSPWGRWRVPLALGLAGMIYLSTSSGGYVALGVLAAVLAASLTLGMFEMRRAAWWGGYAMLMAAGTLSTILLADPAAFDPLYRVFDQIVLHKAGSASYAERSTWNRVAYDAFVGTHYLGAGIGGARASSWIYSLLSNIGAPGTILLFGFMAQVFLTPAADPAERTLARAAKLALVPSLLLASLAATSTGFGLYGATFFGLASALCWPAPASPGVVETARPVEVGVV